MQLGLTGAAMFAADGEVLQPAEVLYKKPVLIERGRFRPVTHVNLDLARSRSRPSKPNARRRRAGRDGVRSWKSR